MRRQSHAETKSIRLAKSRLDSAPLAARNHKLEHLLAVVESTIVSGNISGNKTPHLNLHARMFMLRNRISQ